MRARLLRVQHGFTVLELAVTLAVLAALIAMFGPPLMSALDAERSDTTAAEMAQMYDAILGDQRTRFGYVGDVGTYPTGLADLVISNGEPGWNGPYLGNARVVNGMLMDPYGQPYEYYLVSSSSGSDQLALISRGPDGLSTNTAADPNVAANFTGTAPNAAGYAAGANNADNLIYPAADASNANALNVNIQGTVALNIQNFDSNALVNAFVPACPNLYQVTITSQTRGTQEVTDLGYAPGFQVDVPQGIYQVLVTAQNLSAAPFNERATVIPGETLTRSPNITGLDSSGTNSFVLTVTNAQPSETIRVFEFATLLTAQQGGTTITAGQTKSFVVHGCSQVFIKNTGTTIRDQVIMPWSALSKTVGANAATMTVTNNYTQKIKLFNNDIFLGEVARNKSKSFTTGLLSGDVVKAYDNAVTTLLKQVTLSAGANTVNVP